MKAVHKTATVLLLVGACAFRFASAGGVEDPVPFDISPKVECHQSACTIYFTATIGADVVRSRMLPFTTNSAAMSRIEADTSLGHVLPGEPMRPLATWVMGRNERSVTVGFEVLELPGGRHVVLVHQAGGFDHVKRAHLVFAVDSGRLHDIAQFIEGAGPGTIAVAPVAGGLRVVRTAPGGDPVTENYVWQAGSARPGLRASK